MNTPSPPHPTSLEEWRTAAGIDSLPSQQRARCGIPLHCLYTRANLEQLQHSGYRPPSPVPRSSTNRPWRVGQRHDHPDLATAAAMIAEDMANDVDLLLLEWPQAARQASLSTPSAAHRGGLFVVSVENLTQLFPAGKPLPVLALDAGACALPASALLLAFANQRGAGKSLQAFLGMDPFGALACGACLSLQRQLDGMTEAALYVAQHHPGVKALGVSTSAWHLAGASDVQELAFAAATGCAYLEALIGAGMDVDDACAQLVFTLNADTEFFPQIAKFRAARILWQRIAEAFGARQTHMQIQAESALRFLSRYDPHVNIIRTATAGCAAVMGGVNGLLLHPFTRALGVAETTARRIARNTHFLLSEEAVLGDVTDAAAGCWSIESLTRDMAEAAWCLFQDISRQGGMAAYLRSGRAGELLQEQRAWRARQIATGAARIVGINVHPCLDEEMPPVCGMEAEARRRADRHMLSGLENPSAADMPAFAAMLRQAADGASLGELVAGLGATTAEPIILPQVRESEPWEVLRDKGADFAKRTGSALSVFIVCGAAGDSSRQWLADAKDLLACAGLNIAGETSLSRKPEDIGADCAKSGALFTLVMQTEEIPSTGVAAQACLRAGTKLAGLWRQGMHGAQKNTVPFSIFLDSDSDLPEVFSRIYALLQEKETQP